MKNVLIRVSIFYQAKSLTLFGSYGEKIFSYIANCHQEVQQKVD